MIGILRLTLLSLVVAVTPAGAASRLTMATVLGSPYPLQAIAFPPYSVHPAQFDGLTELDLKGNLALALAQSWKAESPTTWVFDLRPNIVFSNGEPFDATAVAETFAHLRSDEGRRTSAFLEIADVIRVDVRSPLQVALITDRPDLMLPQKLISIKILPPVYFHKVGIDGFNRAPIGTGPFIEKSRSPVRVELSRNPTAWRPPRVDQIVMVSLPDNTSRVQALASRQVDVALDVTVEDAGIVAEAGGRVQPFATGNVEVIQFVTVRPSPLQDKRVRLALNYAVDKQRIVDSLLHGNTRVATQFASRETFGYDPALPVPFLFDPAKAKALLADAGYEKGFDLPIELMNSVGTAPYEQVAADLRAVGVRVTLTNITVQSYTANYYQGTWRGLAFYSGYNAAPSLDALAPLRRHSCLWPKPWHCDQNIAQEVVAAQGIFDRDQRLERTRAIMRQLVEDPPAILLYEAFKLAALGPRVKTFPAPLGFVRYDLMEVAP